MLYAREHQEEDAKGRHRGKVMVHRILSAGRNSLFVTWVSHLTFTLLFLHVKLESEVMTKLWGGLIR